MASNIWQALNTGPTINPLLTNGDAKMYESSAMTEKKARLGE